MKYLIALAAAVLACCSAAAHAAPLEVYGKLPVMSQVSISPDGTKVAFVQPVNGKQMVVVDQINPAAFVTGVAATDQKVRDLIWADATHLLVVKSQSGYAQDVYSGRTEWYMVQCLDVSKRKASVLLSRDTDVGPTSKIRGPQTMNVVMGTPQPRMVKGRSMVFVRTVVFDDNNGVPALVQGEDHWLSREDTRLQMLQETVKFLEANNPPN